MEKQPISPLNHRRATRGGMNMRSQRGAMLLELAIYIGLALLLLTGGALAMRQYRQDARESMCITNLHKIFEAKRTAWIKWEDLSTQSDPDGLIIAYLDPANLPYCPTPGGQVPASGSRASSTNVLASYDFVSGTEGTNPACRITPATHHLRN